MMDRRTVLVSGAAGAGLLACGKGVESANAEPGRGWLVSQNGKTIASEVTGQAVVGSGRAFTADSPFRIASITKLVVAMALRDLAADGKLDLAAHVADILPDTPEGLTLNHLLFHRSGLKDPEVYWADIKTDIRALYNRQSFTHAPGTYFRYANLNTGLAATVAEIWTGQRFDRLIWNWLTRHGLMPG